MVGTYFIKAIDAQGLESVDPTSLVSNVNEVTATNIISIHDEATAGFTGILDNCVISGGLLKLPNTTYMPAAYVPASLTTLGPNQTVDATGLICTITQPGTGIINSSSRANTPISHGKWYWEVTVTSNQPSGQYSEYQMVGVSAASSPTNTFEDSVRGLSYYGYGDGTNSYTLGGLSGSFPLPLSLGPSRVWNSVFNTGVSIVGIAIDADTGITDFYLDGEYQGRSQSQLPVGTVYYPYICQQSNAAWPVGTTLTATFNFGATAYAFTPPTGYSNIDTGVVDEGTYYFTGETLADIQADYSVNLAKVDNYTVDTAKTTWDSCRTSIPVSSGIHYWEVVVPLATDTGTTISIGVATSSLALTGVYVGGDFNGIGYRTDTGSVYVNGAIIGTGVTATQGDTIGVMLDSNTGSLSFYKNGEYNVSINNAILVGSTMYPVVSLQIIDVTKYLRATFNFGNSTGFIHKIPSIALPIDTPTLSLGSVVTSRCSTTMQYATSNQFNVASSWTSMAAVTEFTGSISTDTSATIEISTSADNITWTAWKPFLIGDYSTKYYRFRLKLRSFDPVDSPAVTQLKVDVDMPDRLLFGANITSTAGVATVITFSKAFVQSPLLSITAQNMGTGDYYTITSKSSTGSTVEFFDSTTTSISRVFDWTARGY
jgi:hypothetical protein